MGYAISWLAVHKQMEGSVLTSLDLQKTGETEEIPESDWCMGHVGEWTIVWSNACEPKNFRDLASTFKGEFIVCDVEEHVMFVSTAAFNNGNLSWRITHDAQKSADHLLVQGNPPESLGRIKAEEFARTGKDLEVDCIFEIPVRVAEEIVGFRHDGASQPTFEILRPAAATKPKWKFW